jgi:hypothetical protein
MESAKWLDFPWERLGAAEAEKRGAILTAKNLSLPGEKNTP